MKVWLVAGLAMLFPIAFTALWLGITSLLGLLGGWPVLMRRYPDRDEAPSLRLDSQYGRMGVGVELRGALSLSACPSGLRVAISRFLGPFSKPFFVPWSEIVAEPKKNLFAHLVRLQFGEPEAGALIVYAKTWERLAAGRRGEPTTPSAPLVSA
ncbi:MAG TPA: hypothetical protein VGH15_02565 [Caulobacteraceae bacterium]